MTFTQDKSRNAKVKRMGQRSEGGEKKFGTCRGEKNWHKGENWGRKLMGTCPKYV
jgi:hypothetical protein